MHRFRDNRGQMSVSVYNEVAEVFSGDIPPPLDRN